MSLTITLPPEAEARLLAAAQEQAVTPEELATQTLLEHLPLIPQRPGGASVPAQANAQDSALEAEIAALEAALPPEWRESIGKFDSSQSPTAEQQQERKKIRQKAGAFGEILDEKYRKQGFRV